MAILCWAAKNSLRGTPLNIIIMALKILIMPHNIIFMPLNIIIIPLNIILVPLDSIIMLHTVKGAQV